MPACTAAAAPPGGSSFGWLRVGPGWPFQHLRDAVLVIDPRSGRVSLANPAAADLFGRSTEALATCLATDLVPDLVGRPAWQALASGGDAASDDRPLLDLRAARLSGDLVPVEVCLSPVDGATDPGRFVLAILRQVPDRPSEERLQSALVAQRFLDDASRALSSTLDDTATLSTLVRLAVPGLADLCLVVLLADEHDVARVAGAHVDPEQDARLARLAASYPVGPLPVGPLGGAASGAVQVHPRLTPEDVAALAPDARLGEALASLDLGSALRVPLRSRGRVLGSLLLGAREADRFGPDDATFAADLAQRAALAIDNAWLYRTAQEAIATRDQFLSVAAHELRAPLARLKSHAEVLMLDQDEGQLGPERLAWSVRRINAAADRLTALTRDLLDVSRLRAGEWAFRPRTMCLVDLLRRLAPRLSEQVGQDHSLRFHLPADHLLVVLDEDRLEQILVNLLDNAAKYSPSGGEIEVWVRDAADGVLLTVRDHGAGLPAGSAEVIFAPFGRAPNARVGKVPGMGLGLHICRVIVDRHGGRIWAESEGEGLGTSVHVWLPPAPGRMAGDVQEWLTDQLTLTVGYCELLASNPDLPAEARAQALEAMSGAQDAVATLESLQGRPLDGRQGRPPPESPPERS